MHENQTRAMLYIRVTIFCHRSVLDYLRLKLGDILGQILEAQKKSNLP
jgi:hypothetical protein